MTVGLLYNDEFIGLGELPEIGVLCQLRREMGQSCPYMEGFDEPAADNKREPNLFTACNGDGQMTCRYVNGLGVLGSLVIV